MIKKEELSADKRFYIPADDLDFLYKNNVVFQYAFRSVKIGKIKRWKDGRINTISQTDNYRYINNPHSVESQKAYYAYCEDPKNLEDNPNRSFEEFHALSEKLKENGYDPQKGVIILNQYLCVVNGLHRCCILLSEYGPDYELPVLIVTRKTSRKLILLNLLFEIRRMLIRK